MRLTLGFSPCPNDTFIFDAMVHGRVDTEGLTFDYFLADVEELNRRALQADVDITKISYHAFAYVAKNYYVLDAGSALGYKNGPLIISKNKIDPSEFSSLHIAIPGKFTTANLLMNIAWPDAKNKTEYLFSDIERAILLNEVDAGLIIHETRFTYMSKGLRKFADMGEYWERLTGLPIPLGSIVIKRTIPEDIALKVNRVLKRSIEYAYMDSLASYDFVSNNAREMDSTVMNNHIKLFVNEFTTNLGVDGRKAIETLFSIARERGVIPELPEKIFLTDEESA
jgi:1,4-dihydroxy-6-naphthoate synthase